MTDRRLINDVASPQTPHPSEPLIRKVTWIGVFVRQHLIDKGSDKEEQLKDVWIDFRLNELIWSKGIEHPPRKVRVKAIRFEDGLIEVSLPEE